MKAFVIVTSLIFATTANAGHFIGFSTGSVSGNAGLLGMNQAFVATYGESVKFCSSKDILWSPSLTAQTDTAWVQPIIVGVTNTDKDWLYTVLVEYSGLVSRGGFSCQGWSSNDQRPAGLIVRSNLAFNTSSCSAHLHVACCKATAAYRIAPN